MDEKPVPAGSKQDTRFKPGKSGNPAGRRKGSRNKATMAALALLEADAATIAAKAIELALGGDTTALRLVLERIVAPRREMAVQFKLPHIESVADLPGAVAALLSAVAAGELTPSEGQRLASIIGDAVKALELVDIEQRLARLEGAQ